MNRYLGIEKITTGSHNPRSNAVVERFMQHFNGRLTKCDDSQYKNMKDFLPALAFAHNTAFNSAINCTPFEAGHGLRAKTITEARANPRLQITAEEGTNIQEPDSTWEESISPKVCRLAERLAYDASILAFFTAHSQPLPSLIVDNETSLEECREYFLSQRLPVTFVPPQTHRSNPAERAVRTGKNHLISVFSSTHPDFLDNLWDRLLPYAEITLNVLHPWRPDPTLSAWSGLHRLPYDFSVYPLHPPWPTLSCLLQSRPPRHLGPSRGSRFYPWSSPYPLPLSTCLRRLRSERITFTLAHFPVPLFHFAESDLPPPLPPTPLPPVPPLLSTARI
jgi:hypothetical protein